MSPPSNSLSQTVIMRYADDNFRHRPGVVSPEAASPSDAPPVSEALVSDKKLLSLCSPVTAVMPLCGPPWGLLFKTIN